MLALTRYLKPGQNTVLLRTEAGEEIKVQILEHKGDKVRLGFEAPDTVKILREELLPDE